MISSWAGPPAMLTIFRKMFGSFAAPHIIKQNNFDNLQHYYLQKTIPVAMAGKYTFLTYSGKKHRFFPEYVLHSC